MALVSGAKDPNKAAAGGGRLDPAARPSVGRSLAGGPAGRTGGAPAAEEATPGGVLVIGREIEVKGKIGSCKTLVVEGRLEADVEVGSLHLADAGLFDGKAVVEDADIAGRFEGELTVHGHLLLRPTARVRGQIRYGRIVIEEGGEISGDVAVIATGQPEAPPQAS